MNEAEYLMKNYADRGGCYLSRPWAEAHNTLQEMPLASPTHKNDPCSPTSPQ